jgi:hypothetical protein
MPWDRRWINTSGFPPGHPQYRDVGFWQDKHRPGPEDFPDEVEQVKTIASQLGEAKHPTEIADLLRRAQDLAVTDHYWTSLPFASVSSAWKRLVDDGALGRPTHDMVELDVSGKNSRLRFAERSRRPVWRSPHAGTFEGRPVDLWVEPDGDIWPLYNPRSSDGGGTHNLKRNVRGEVYEPQPVWLALRPGGRAETRTSGMYYQRHIEFVDAVMLRGDDNPSGIHTPHVSGGLFEVALALVTQHTL